MNNEQQHTSEPWSIHDNHVWGYMSDVPIIEDLAQDNAQKANYRRIVACVNACKGIKTVELETMVAQGLPILGRIQKLTEDLNESMQTDEPESELDRLKKENAQLVSALKAVQQDCVESNSFDSTISDKTIELIKTAIYIMDGPDGETMSRSKAIEALYRGEKITHKRFLEGEFVYMKGGAIFDEHDNIMHNFWKVRSWVLFDHGWSVVPS